MADVVCSGFEARLTSCSHISNHNCGHSEDASTKCPLTQQAQRTGYVHEACAGQKTGKNTPTSSDNSAIFCVGHYHPKLVL